MVFHYIVEKLDRLLLNNSLTSSAFLSALLLSYDCITEQELETLVKIALIK